jgi:Gene product 88
MRLFGIILSEGNGKIGEVLNFSLPSIITCPGASEWCKKYCYSNRYEKRRPKCRQAYQHNFRLAQDTAKLTETMIGVLPRIAPCFRIHVSGDLFSAAYIDAWHAICSAFPQVRFWTYTRSWVSPELLPNLEKLRALSNVQIFASVDPTMPLPPKGWRTAFIKTDHRAKGKPCNEQTGLEDSCLACGYCFRQRQGDVIFRVH